MPESTELYEYDSDLPALDKPVLLCSLDGFMDAGGVGGLIRERILADLDHRVVATFDVDRLIDYRSRRPAMTYAEDHWESYDIPELVLRLVRDTTGVPFLLLSGPEPDHEWERFTAAVREMVERFDVAITVGFHGIPMAVPHTRPTGLTAHATRPELVAGYTRWVSRVEVPGSAAALLELRLGEAGRDALGFAVHVPHYLSQSAYPQAALAALEAIHAATGLSLPDGELRAAADDTGAEIARQVEGSEEVANTVRALERQYDAYIASREQDGSAAADLGDLPTADELGAEFERFLAERDRGTGPSER